MGDGLGAQRGVEDGGLGTRCDVLLGQDWDGALLGLGLHCGLDSEGLDWLGLDGGTVEEMRLGPLRDVRLWLLLLLLDHKLVLLDLLVLLLEVLLLNQLVGLDLCVSWGSLNAVSLD